jgi:CBS domain-containing protein
MQVKEIMTQNPACCTPDSTLQEVARMMKDNDCGCIPVVDSQQGMKPVGTITDRDITIRTVADNHNPINMKASDIMTANIATVTPQASVEECFDVMEDREIRRVLVVDEQGKCCGIVAQADVVQSGASPIRTNKVIREISESAPSQNQIRSAKQGNNKFGSSMKSFMSSDSMLPLLIGLGSGVAVMYWLNTRQKSSNQTDYSGVLNSGISESGYSNATNQENFGKYADAEQEIENRQNKLQDNIKAFRTQPNVSSGDLLELPYSEGNEDDTLITEEKRRSAGSQS